MLTAVKLVDQWATVERRLPSDWESVELRLRTEQPDERSEAARILGPMNVGLVGEELAFAVRRAGGAAGPQAARRLFARLDEARIWSILQQRDVDEAPPELDEASAATTVSSSVAASWDAALAALPSGWSDLLCLLQLDSSALLDRAALLCAPINPTRDHSPAGFTFRCASTTGYGVSPGMARRCFEELDEERIGGTVSVLRSLSNTDNVATQGAVWYVGGKVV
jgi:hypothetical protein